MSKSSRKGNDCSEHGGRVEAKMKQTSDKNRGRGFFSLSKSIGSTFAFAALRCCQCFFCLLCLSPYMLVARLCRTRPAASGDQTRQAEVRWRGTGRSEEQTKLSASDRDRRTEKCRRWEVAALKKDSAEDSWGLWLEEDGEREVSQVNRSEQRSRKKLPVTIASWTIHRPGKRGSIQTNRRRCLFRKRAAPRTAKSSAEK